jgi:hypothetical protein
VAAQVMATRVVLSSTELVSCLDSNFTDGGKVASQGRIGK